MKFKILCFTGIIIFSIVLAGCPTPVEETTKSGNADLTSLEINTGVLSPAFDSSKTIYSVTVPNTITQISVTAVSADATAVLSVNNGIAQDLKVGANKITISVTAQDGSTKKEYLILVSRWGAETLSSNVGVMISVPAGRFQRYGSSGNVSVVDGFMMGCLEISREKFLSIMGGDPSRPLYSESTGPVIDQSWYHAIAFCNKLSLEEELQPVYTVAGVDFSILSYSAIPAAADTTWDSTTADWSANGYRLPTEMEWMWAAMGAPADGQNGSASSTGDQKAFAGSTGINTIGDYAWYSVNCGNGDTENVNYKAHPVGDKLPNELGLFDMSGNVWERCWDWKDTYPDGLLENYRGAATGDRRVHRGAGWDRTADDFVISDRSSYYPYGGAWSIGFRIVRKLP